MKMLQLSWCNDVSMREKVMLQAPPSWGLKGASSSAATTAPSSGQTLLVTDGLSRYAC